MRVLTLNTETIMYIMAVVCLTSGLLTAFIIGGGVWNNRQVRHMYLDDDRRPASIMYTRTKTMATLMGGSYVLYFVGMMMGMTPTICVVTYLVIGALWGSHVPARMTDTYVAFRTRTMVAYFLAWPFTGPMMYFTYHEFKSTTVEAPPAFTPPVMRISLVTPDAHKWNVVDIKGAPPIPEPIGLKVAA